MFFSEKNFHEVEISTTKSGFELAPLHHNQGCKQIIKVWIQKKSVAKNCEKNTHTHSIQITSDFELFQVSLPPKVHQKEAGVEFFDILVTFFGSSIHPPRFFFT